MSDAYGVGNALKAFHHSITMASRRTGRTTRMLEQVKSGDMIVMVSEDRRRHIEPLLKEMGKDVSFCACDPSTVDRLFNARQPKGYVHFDHEWIDEYYRIGLEHISEQMMKMPRQLSGPGVAHAETRLQARRLGRYPSFEDLNRIPDDYRYDDGPKR